MRAQDFYQQAIPVLGEADVLVVGGGTAGSVAAIAAARSGADTLLIEDLGFLGGTQTAALVTPQMPNLVGGRPLNTGIDSEINGRMASLGAADTYKDGNAGWFDPEMLKCVFDDLLAEAGAKVLFFTRFEDVIINGNRLLGVVALSKSGRQAILAKRIIDCTGDGDVAYRAGVGYEAGDSLNGKNQPLSVRFNLANVDIGKLSLFLESLGPLDKHLNPGDSNNLLIHSAMVWGSGWPLEKVFRGAVEAGILAEADGNYFQMFSIPGRPGELAFNCPRISDKTNGTRVDHLTSAMCNGRKAIRRYVEFCRRCLPGCERSYLACSSVVPGVRETRRIKGIYRLTVEDVLSARKFDDGVARCNYPVDVHRDPGEKGGGLTHIPAGEYYEIPYRCLVNENIENLLVAGRCLSADFEAQASARIQPVCRALGQAAGVAAALSLKLDVSTPKLNGVKLRQELAAMGCSLEEQPERKAGL
ncbi:MAG: FAD-dependent oxidoreductase [Candidatus Rifleibacteriota bacterium]